MNAQQIIEASKPSVARQYAESIYAKALTPKQIYVKRVDGIWQIDIR